MMKKKKMLERRSNVTQQQHPPHTHSPTYTQTIQPPPPTHLNQGLAVNQFKGEHFSCNDVDVAGGDTCVRTGDETIRRLSFGGETPAQAMGALLALIVGFNFAAYVVLRIKKKKYQPIAPP